MSIRPQLIVAAVCIALGAAAAWTAQEWRHDAKHARLIAEHSQVLEAQASAVVESVQAARNEEQRRMDELEKQRDIAQQVAASARADASARAASERRLRNRIDTLLADARSRHPSLADGGPPAGAPIDMLAYVLDGALEAAGQLAEYADQARGAGLTCERSYDAVREGALITGESYINKTIASAIPPASPISHRTLALDMQSLIQHSFGLDLD